MDAQDKQIDGVYQRILNDEATELDRLRWEMFEEEHRLRYTNWFDRQPRWLQVVVVAAASLYFGFGFIVPFFWKLPA
jgi:hypothetical protein